MERANAARRRLDVEYFDRRREGRSARHRNLDHPERYRIQPAGKGARGIPPLRPGDRIPRAFSAPGVLIASPITVWRGLLDQPTIDVSADTASISINCESRLIEMNVAVDRRYTDKAIPAMSGSPSSIRFRISPSIGAALQRSISEPHQCPGVQTGRLPSMSSSLQAAPDVSSGGSGIVACSWQMQFERSLAGILPAAFGRNIRRLVRRDGFCEPGKTDGVSDHR